VQVTALRSAREYDGVLLLALCRSIWRLRASLVVVAASLVVAAGESVNGEVCYDCDGVRYPGIHGVAIPQTVRAMHG
jgi:hypothetical protein